nr:MAG TPA: hypothetical protein [Caudoviricetes sp.]
MIIHTSSNTPPPFLDILKCFCFPSNLNRFLLFFKLFF